MRVTDKHLCILKSPKGGGGGGGRIEIEKELANAHRTIKKTFGKNCGSTRIYFRKPHWETKQ